MRAWWEEKRIDIYLATVIISAVILSVLALWMLIRQYFFINYLIKTHPLLYGADATQFGLISKLGIFAFSMVILSLLLILIIGSFLSTQNMQRQLEVAQLKNEFVSTVSHELKTPLTSISILAERLLKLAPGEDPKKKEYVALILTQSHHLSHLIGNILDFSKIEEGKLKYAYTRQEIKPLLEESLRNYPAALTRPDCVLELNVTPGLPALQLDKEAICRAFTNLLDNALKFSPSGGTISINSGRTGKNVFIEVTDKGKGIAKEERDKVFERFYHTGHGTGLGLTIARHIIVEGHKGKIEVEDNPGGGSIFRILLPLPA
jgi:two-component system phosphate regulon sensor histidine kinase PhoR